MPTENEKFVASGLTKVEIAAITAGVPMTGNKQLDSIITVAMRLRIATELLAANQEGADPETQARTALTRADALIKQFETGN